MASEDATPSVNQHDQAPSVYESVFGDQADNTNPPENRQLNINTEDDPFSSIIPNQQNTPPAQLMEVQVPQPATVYIAQSPTEIISRRDADNMWIHDGIPRNQSNERRANHGQQASHEHQAPERPLPHTPSVRLPEGTDYMTSRPRPKRNISIDASNHRLSNQPQTPHQGRNLSRHATIDDRGEKFYDDNGRVLYKGSIKERLAKTIESAESERDKYASRAQATGLALNIAIGLQVLLGSLTTGLSAVATRGKNAAVATTILGALATLVASYLARARGSNEPELSITRTKDLEHFLRECKNFSDDHGAYVGSDHDDELENFRRRFEELLGNANGERKLSPPGS